MNSLYKFLLSAILIFSTANAKLTLTESSPKAGSTLTESEINEAFISAVKTCNSQKMEELIELGANVNAPISYTDSDYDDYWHITESPLLFAIHKKQPKMVKTLLRVKSKLETPLNKALYEGIGSYYLEIVEDLIQAGAEINCQKKGEESPLSYAARCGAFAIVESFIKKGAHIDSVDQLNNTPLLYAVENAYQKIIKILLAAGADIRHANNVGKTALMMAVKNVDVDTVQTLLKLPKLTQGSFFGFGKKPLNHADKDGNTAVIIAVENIETSYISGNTKEYNRCINSQKIAEELFKVPGIDLHHANKKGETAISLLKKIRIN